MLRLPSRLQTDGLFLLVLMALIGAVFYIVSYRPSEPEPRKGDTPLWSETLEETKHSIDSAFWAKQLPWYSGAAERVEEAVERYRRRPKRDTIANIPQTDTVSISVINVFPPDPFAAIEDSLEVHTQPDGEKAQEPSLLTVFWVSFVGTLLLVVVFFWILLSRLHRRMTSTDSTSTAPIPTTPPTPLPIQMPTVTDYSVESLDWSVRNLTNFSDEMDDLSEYQQLKRLNLSYNQFEEVPMELETLVKLEQLDLSHNRIAELDEWALEKLFALQQLDLSHNQIETIPRMVLRLPALRRLILVGNPIDEDRIQKYQRQAPKLKIEYR